MKRKLKIQIAIIVLILISIEPSSAEPIGNDYGFANGWFNGQEATVKNINLRIGEPAEIKVTVTSNISGHVIVKLTNPLVTKPYQVVEGTEVDQRIDNLNVPAGWSKTFNWKIKPNGDWKNGNAPINVIVQFYNLKTKDDKLIEFTIANPYILDEQYSGAAQTPQPTATAPGATAPKAAPFPPVLGAIAMLLAVWAWRRLRLYKLYRL